MEDPEYAIEMLMEGVDAYLGCWSNDDCRNDEIDARCGWIEMGGDWTDDFCMPAIACG